MDYRGKVSFKELTSIIKWGMMQAGPKVLHRYFLLVLNLLESRELILCTESSRWICPKKHLKTK